jgi:hypothetical protein
MEKLRSISCIEGDAEGLKTAQCNEAFSEGSTLSNEVCLNYEQEIKWIWVEVRFVHASKAHVCRVEVYRYSFIKVALDEGVCFASCHICFTHREGAASTHWIGGWMCLRASLDVLETRDVCCLCPESKLAKSSRTLYWKHCLYILLTWIAYKIIYRLIVCRLARRGRPWAQVCWTATSVGWIVFQNLSLQAWMCSRNQSDKHYSCPAWWDA